MWFPDPIGARECQLVAAGVTATVTTVPESVTPPCGTDGAARESPVRLPPPPRSARRGLGRDPDRSGRDASWKASETIVYGVVDRMPVVAGTVLALAALELAGLGSEAGSWPVGVRALGEVVTPVPFLTELAHRGVKAAVVRGGRAPPDPGVAEVNESPRNRDRWAKKRVSRWLGAVPTPWGMATLGTPPAGWYTDPSGQHRARYWDGGGWTEQVRDDVGAPSAVSGGEQAHEAAATVANIAQALATVAEQDVAEPVFVVDYGTAEPRVRSTRDGDPIPSLMDSRCSRPRVAPELPQPSLTQPSPVIPNRSGRDWPRFRLVSGPVDAAPGALWDGFKWTERVADDGTEGVDPVPGTAAVQTADTMMGGVDPAAAAWSAQLLGNTDVDGATPPVAVRQSDGECRAGVAGDASRPRRLGTTSPCARGPPTKVVVAGWMIVAGALALIVGSTLTWMTVRGPRVGDSATATGMSIGDGRITVVLAIALAVLGAGLLTGRLRKLGGTKVAAMGALVAGAAGVAVTAIDIADVADRARSASACRPAR